MTLTRAVGFVVGITPYFLTWIPHRVKPERGLIGSNHLAGIRKRWKGQVETLPNPALEPTTASARSALAAPSSLHALDGGSTHKLDVRLRPEADIN